MHTSEEEKKRRREEEKNTNIHARFAACSANTHAGFVM
jgi:hypothetical protein